MVKAKTNQELTKMRKAGIIVALAHRAASAAMQPGITTQELDRIIEKVIREPEPANEENLPEIAEEIREDLDGFLRKSCQKTREQIVEERYERFRRM